MGITFLIIFIIAIIFISYKMSNKDLMSPAVLLSIGYFVAFIACTLNINKWEVNLHVNTVVLLVVGILSFTITEWIINIGFKKKNKNMSDKMENTSQIIKVPNWVSIICFLFNIVIFALCIMDIYKVTGGRGSINDMMNVIRTGGEGLSTYIIQLRKISKGIGYVFLFIFCNNFFATKKLKENVKYLLIAVTYVLISLCSGGRLSMLAFAVATVGLLFYNYGVAHSWRKGLTYKMLIILLICFILFISVFYATKELVGRKNDQNMFDYMTRYLGGSIELLDEYLNSNITIIDEIETFPGIVKSLNKIGIINKSASKGLEYRHDIDGKYLGNVYTGLRRYYNDFGYLGVIAIQMAYSLLFNLIYREVKYGDKNKTNNLFITIFYYYSIFAILTQAMEDHFFIDLSLGYLAELVLVYFVVYFIKKRMKLKEIADNE